MAIDGKVVIDTEVNDSGAKAGMSKLGATLGKVGGAAVSGVKAAIGASVAAISGATVAVGGLVSASVKAYSAYEQLTGGVETLFKQSSPMLMEYANNAYKTAGMSANAYMETVTGFSASLLQSLGGDTAKAAKYANSAVIDMSDNANKMGTDVEMIKNAYGGFAKQNYTMLDNLKLGFGGTKEEMQRLLDDAEKISGVKYDISSYADVTQAIHVMQESMGIAGTTAKEASTTIEGSANAMKASWENLLVGISGGGESVDELIGQFTDSVETFSGNIVPIISKAVVAAGGLIVALLPQVLEEIPNLVGQIAPMVLQAGVTIIDAIVQGMASNPDGIANGILTFLGTIGSLIVQFLPQLVEVGFQIISGVMEGIIQNAPLIIEGFSNLFASLSASMGTWLPILLQLGLDILMAIGQGLIDNADLIAEVITELILMLVDFVIANLSTIITMIITIITAIATALVENLPIIIEKLPELVEAIIKALIDNLPLLVAAVIEIIVALAVAIVESIPLLLEGLDTMSEDIKKYLSDKIPEWKKAGIEFVKGLWDGIVEKWEDVKKNFQDLINQLLGKAEVTIKTSTSTSGSGYVGGGRSTSTSAQSSNSGNSAMQQLQNAVQSTMSNLQMNATIASVSRSQNTPVPQQTNFKIDFVGGAAGLFEAVAKNDDLFYNRVGQSRFERRTV